MLKLIAGSRSEVRCLLGRKNVKCRFLVHKIKVLCECLILESKTKPEVIMKQKNRHRIVCEADVMSRLMVMME
jgi:hypothetical protein